jgi:pyruvate dehydrogenase E2 component (dihydrolipoamide acetyltransferase)
LSQQDIIVPIEQVTVPDIGGAEGAEVIEVLVAVGDQVALDQSLIVLESDKASMEIPSTVAGTVVELLVKEGDQLAEGAPIIKVEVASGTPQETSSQSESSAASDKAAAGSDKKAATPESAAVAAKSPEADEHPNRGKTGDAPAENELAKAEPDSEAVVNKTASVPAKVESNVLSAPAASATADADANEPTEFYAGPAVRKLARELGVQLGRVAGSGPQGRILKEDLQQFVHKALNEPSATATGGAALPVVPEIDFAKFGEVEVTQRSKLDKLTAANMHRSWLNVPHVTQFDDADITDLEAFRATLKREAERREIKLSPLPFVLKACAVALRDNPKINSSLARGGEDLVYKHYIHIGMAVDTPAGLVVPVIRDVDRKSIWELAAEVAELAAKARDRKLSPAEMQGGCFTVSSLGNIGGNGFTPIVNTPEVAILGVSKAAIKPVWNGTEFAPRTLLPLALSYDHRVVNGGDGGRFLTQLAGLLGDIRQLSM